MKDTQSAVLEYVIINAPLAWAGERTFLMPPPCTFSLFLSELYTDRLSAKGLLSACEKTKRCRAQKCTTKRPGYWKVTSAFLFRRITRPGRPHTHLRWGLSYKVNPDMKEPQSRKKNKTKLPSNGDAVRPTDGTCAWNPPGKQVVRDRRVTIHTQREKATSKGPRDHGAYGRSQCILPHSTSDLPYTHTKHLSSGSDTHLSIVR